MAVEHHQKESPDRSSADESNLLLLNTSQLKGVNTNPRHLNSTISSVDSDQPNLKRKHSSLPTACQAAKITRYSEEYSGEFTDVTAVPIDSFKKASICTNLLKTFPYVNKFKFFANLVA